MTENTVRPLYQQVCGKILELFSDIKRNHRRDEIYDEIRTGMDQILYESDQNTLLINNLKSENETLKRKLQMTINGLDSYDSAMRDLEPPIRKKKVE